MPSSARHRNHTAAMSDEPIMREQALLIERSETEAWIDLYAAAPAGFAAKFGLAIEQIDGAVATFCKAIPFIHFNCVMNLGYETEASPQQIDRLLGRYEAAGIKGPWFYHIPQAQPAALPQWLAARGLKQRGGWDRIWRDAAPLPAGRLSREGQVERVTPDTAAEWAGFIDATYGLPTSPWLLALVERPGWSHYALRNEGKILAVRSLYLGPNGLAWSGIEAPVPGIMAASFGVDAAIVEMLLRDALAGGARLLAADIEAPRADMDGPAYDNFGMLGFRKAYFRQHYGI